jgi:pilus assembly protein Flp/PilA
MKDKQSKRATFLESSKKLMADTRGAGLVEYIVLIGLIALVAASGFEYFGDKVHDKAEDLGDEVEGLGD